MTTFCCVAVFVVSYITFYLSFCNVIITVHALKDHGHVIRLAARKYHPKHSKPSSSKYTTRKDEFDMVNVLYDGCREDYNHYRTIALQSTIDRAISILTNDVMTSLRATYPSYKTKIKNGDLGENILIGGDNIKFNDFKIGCQYCIDSTSNLMNIQIGSDKSSNDKPNEDNELSNNDDNAMVVIIEITEPIIACANLCKLSYINDEAKAPKQRIQQCQEFINHLNQYDGYRGWYAKVIQEGTIVKGARIYEIDNDSSSSKTSGSITTSLL